MSWSRTAVAMVVVALVLLRWADVYGPAVLLLIALLALSAGFVVLSNHADYKREVAGLEDERVQPNMHRVLVLTASVILLGVGSIALVLAQ